MNSSDQITFIQNKKPVQLFNENILFIKSAGDYVRLITPERRYITHSTIKDFAANVNPNVLVRVHRCFIVNIRKATVIDEKAVQVGNTIIPISRTYKAALLQKMVG